MSLNYRAAVLHKIGAPLAIEQVQGLNPSPADVVVRVQAAGLCHTDLEAIEGSLHYPLPMIVGHGSDNVASGG